MASAIWFRGRTGLVFSEAAVAGSAARFAARTAVGERGDERLAKTRSRVPRPQGASRQAGSKRGTRRLRSGDAGAALRLRQLLPNQVFYISES